MEHAAASPATETRVLLDKNSTGIPTLAQKPQLRSGISADGSAYAVRVHTARRKRARHDSLLGAFCAWLENHQIGMNLTR